MTQHPLWRLQTVSRFPVCYYIQFAWEVFCSFEHLPSPPPPPPPYIFIKYFKTTILSTWWSIPLTFLYFVNLCLASFTANNSRILMWYFVSWADNILTVDIPLQVAPQTFVEVSVWDLDLSSTIVILLLIGGSELFRTTDMNGFPLIMIFAAAEETYIVISLTILLGLLPSTNQSLLLILKSMLLVLSVNFKILLHFLYFFFCKRYF